MVQLTGKVAVVTGGGRGIGKAISLALAGEGADVVVAAEAMPLLEETARQIEANGQKSLAVLMDLLDSKAPRRMPAPKALSATSPRWTTWLAGTIFWRLILPGPCYARVTCWKRA